MHYAPHMNLSIAPHTSVTLLFFFNDTATTEIYTLSLHDALPISAGRVPRPAARGGFDLAGRLERRVRNQHGRRPCWFRDRKSTRLNSSHRCISYAVFCLKKKKKKNRK